VVKVRNSAADGYDAIDFFNNSDTLSASVGFGNPSASTLTDLGYLGTNANKHLVFFTNGPGNERARITNDGKFGVKTTNPQTDFDVEGSAQFGSTAKSTFTADGVLMMTDGSASNPSISWDSGSVGFSKLPGSVGVLFSGVGLPRMWFTDQGRLGIGAFPQSPALLDVEGAAQFGSIGKTTVSAEGYINAPAGAVGGSPSLSFGTFNTTGFYRAINGIGLTVTGSHKMMFADNGRFGVGMTVPAGIIHASSGPVIFDGAGAALYVGGDNLFVENDRVGINQPLPLEALDVVGNAKVSGTVAAGGGTNIMYYCSGSTAGTFDGNLARGNSNAGACAGGTWVATSYRMD
jgi:hypothetical protein